MICITAARFRAQAFHPGRALLGGLLDDEAPTPGLAPHLTAWTISLDRVSRTPDGHAAFEAVLTIGWGPDHTAPWETPITLAETRHPCRLVVSGGGATLETPR